jgi:adenine-specific DNA-methyltransferase
MEENNNLDLLQTNLDALTESELRKLLTLYMTQQKLGLYWERNQIEHDKALNSDAVFLCSAEEHGKPLSVGDAPYSNLIIEGDNFDALRCLRATHTNKIRVIYIDPPYNTGNKDWVYNDRYVNKEDRYKASMWLEFLYRRLLLARDLLTSDGVILVSINDENRAKLELLMDQVFLGMRLGSITWRTRQGSNADQQCFLSVDHEHILVYGREGFQFRGFTKSYEMYSNPDNDPRGDWRPDNLTLGFSYKERPNLYYPLIDPKTGIAYPPNPDRVWVYATQDRLKEGQKVQAKTMEEFIELGQIIFPSEQRIETWYTLTDLLAAIDAGDVPKSGKTPILRRDLPDLEFWVGRPVGFGRPQFKRYKADLRNQTQPLSSWVVPTFEAGDYEAENSFVSGTNQEGARVVADIFGNRSFNYAKPLSLIKNLLQQATQPDDIVLDFFAGSGTTAQAVLQLNQEDQGNRRFILVSSTEAPPNDPDNKNLCRDVCRVRVQRVIEGYNNAAATGGNFAYCRIEKIPPADVMQDLDESLIWNRLCLIYRGELLMYPDKKLNMIYQDAETAVIFCPHLDEETITELKSFADWRVVLYSDRPDSAAELLEPSVSIQSLSAIDAVLPEQG